MNPRYARVADRAEHSCEYCRAPEAVFNAPFEVEHIIPRLHGGTDTEENLALACRSCNGHKAAAVTHMDPQIGQTVELFHPRQDRWREHFRVDADTAEVVGITSAGRATVARLSMNSASQVGARRL